MTNIIYFKNIIMIIIILTKKNKEGINKFYLKMKQQQNCINCY